MVKVLDWNMGGPSSNLHTARKVTEWPWASHTQLSLPTPGFVRTWWLTGELCMFPREKAEYNCKQNWTILTILLASACFSLKASLPQNKEPVLTVLHQLQKSPEASPLGLQGACVHMGLYEWPQFPWEPFCVAINCSQKCPQAPPLFLKKKLKAILQGGS